MRPDGPGPGLVALGGLALFPLAALGFFHTLDLSVLEALFLGVLTVLFPAMAVAQVPLAESRAESVDRMTAYLGTSLTLMVLAAMALALTLPAAGPARLGLDPLPAGRLVAGMLAVLLVAGALIGLAEALRKALDLDESPLLRALLPRSGRERAIWVGVSCVAGFGEEVVFRGFAIPALAPLLGGPWGAAAFTSAAFGVLHAYQGPLGVLRTGALGFVLAASFLLLGNLWPAVAAHVIIDVVGGLWLGPRLAGLRRDEASATSPT